MSSTFETDPQYLAQVGHGFGGAFVILTATLFSIVLHPRDASDIDLWLPILIVLGVGILAAAFKEFFLDMRPPENDSFPNSLMDFGFYLVGASVGMIEAAIAIYLVER